MNRFLIILVFVLTSSAGAQEIPKTGVLGIDLVFASSPTGDSQLFAFAPNFSTTLIPIGGLVNGLPSRWAHRRRTLGAMETSIVFVECDGAGIAVCPMGDATGNGAIFLADFRLGTMTATYATNNPAAYDVAVMKSLKMLFIAEDAGNNTTLLRGYSYATPGQLIATNPATLTIPGSPAAYCNRIGVQENAGRIHVPTTDGIQIVAVAGSFPQIDLGNFVLTSPHSPTTNPISFDRNGVTTWMIGTSGFDLQGKPSEAGYQTWTANDAGESGIWGTIPGLSPPRSFVPAAGCHEIALVSDGTDAFAYYLLRDPSPTALFIRPSAIGVVRLLGSQPAIPSFIPCPPDMGEPFAIPTVKGTRVAIESSYGPPFINQPAGGGEKISVLYSPLDPLGIGSVDGVLGVPDPLGGRISTKGMDRPIWSRSGDRILACTSHFPGAPNPGTPGIESLSVSPFIPLDPFISPHPVIPYVLAPNRSIIHPNIFDPRVHGAASFLNDVSIVGNVFHDGMASILATPFGEIGQFQQEVLPFVQDPDIPNFPGVFPPSFEYAVGTLTPPPADFGARRTTFNIVPGLGLDGLLMTAAIGDIIQIQLTGFNFLAAIGWHPSSANSVKRLLPAGLVTTS